MAETFGEADVILRVRLDELQKQLDESEAMVAQSTERVASAQHRAYTEMQSAADAAKRTGEESSETWSMLGHAAITAAGLYFRLGKVLALARTAMMALTAAAVAAKLAVVGLAAGGIVLLGLLVDKMFDAADAISDIAKAASALDGTEQRAQELAEQLQRIPLIGDLIAASFLAIAGHGEKATEIMSSFAIAVEDGEVKVRFLAKAVSGIISGLTLGQVNFKREIEDTVKQVEELNRRLEAQTGVYQTIASVSRSAADARIRAEREAALVGVEGVERVRMEEQHKREDIARAFEDRKRQLNEEFSLAKANAQANAQSARERRTLVAAVAAAEMSALNNLESERKRADDAAIEAAEKRIRLKREEIREQERLNQAKLKEQAFEGFITGEQTRLETQAIEAEAAGNPFEAQRLQADSAYFAAQNRLLKDMSNIDMEKLDMLKRQYDARMQIIDQREREAMEQERKFAEESAMQQLQIREDLRSRVHELQLRMAGEEMAAQEEAIRRQAQVQIDQFEADGDRIAASLARKLRDLQIDALQQEQRIESVGRSARFEQVSFSRIALDAKRPEAERMERISRDQLAELRGINQAIRDRATIAVVG